MRFTLNYCIDDVLVTLSVDADTPEQGELKMKKCVAKMLRRFPVGLLFQTFSNLGWQEGQITTTPNPDWQNVQNGGYITVGGSIEFNSNGIYNISNVQSTSGDGDSMTTTNTLTNGSFSLTAAYPSVSGSSSSGFSSGSSQGIGNSQ